MKKIKLQSAIIKIGGSILSNSNSCVNGFFNYSAVTQLIKVILGTIDKGVFIIGGGKINKWLLENAKNNIPSVSIDDQHYIGIAALNVNAELFKICFKYVLGKGNNKSLYDNIIRYADFENEDKLESMLKKHDYVIAGANKPGTSSDYDALLLAKLINAKSIVSVKNVDKVYTDDPNVNPNAKPIDKIRWHDYLKIINAKKHEPRGNYPVDPVTAKRAQEMNIRFVIVGASDMNNVKLALHGKPFYGSVIY